MGVHFTTDVMHSNQRSNRLALRQCREVLKETVHIHIYSIYMTSPLFNFCFSFLVNKTKLHCRCIQSFCFKTKNSIASIINEYSVCSKQQNIDSIIKAQHFTFLFHILFFFFFRKKHFKHFTKRTTKECLFFFLQQNMSQTEQ